LWYCDKQFDDDKQANEAQDSKSRRKEIGHEMKIVAELMIEHVGILPRTNNATGG
jgi:hypothetical protein